jgi:dCMP deaminase
MTSKKSERTIVAYVPAVHAGYLKLFRNYPNSVLYVLGSGFIGEFKSLVRNLPAAQPSEVAAMVRALDIFKDVRVLSTADLVHLEQIQHLIMPDEDVSREFAKKYLTNVDVTFDGAWRLRWDWGATVAHRKPAGERVVSINHLDQELMLEAQVIAMRSPDWWRQIGALLVKDGRILFASFNTHMPSEQSAYLEGDPRSNFDPGQHIDASLALHAEVGVLTAAAKRGIKTEGCDLYTTTFPCPPCAYAAANSGIKRLFYADGYSLVVGAEALESRGVEIIRVEMNPPASK